MSPSQIGVQITVDKKKADLLLRSIEVTLMGGNIVQFLQSVMQPYLQGRAAARFGSEGDDATGAWAALSPATEDIRESMGYARDHPINRRTGALENFMTHGNAEFTMAPMSAGMFFPRRPPTDKLKRKFSGAQTGKDGADGDTVPRPVAAVSMTDMTYLITSFTFWFGREVQQAFGA